LWNIIKSWFSGPAAPPTLVLVEEESCVEGFIVILRNAGAYKEAKKVNAVELFADWYDGPCDEESIRASMESFKKAHPLVNAKIAGKI